MSRPLFKASLRTSYSEHCMGGGDLGNGDDLILSLSTSVYRLNNQLEKALRLCMLNGAFTVLFKTRFCDTDMQGLDRRKGLC
jgi:hypothetical protein